MKEIRKIPTGPIPDGYYTQEWSLEGAILRDKINQIIDALEEKYIIVEPKCPIPQPTVYQTVPNPIPPIESKQAPKVPVGIEAHF